VVTKSNKAFTQDLAAVIRKHHISLYLSTPEEVIASLVANCLDQFAIAIHARDSAIGRVDAEAVDIGSDSLFDPDPVAPTVMVRRPIQLSEQNTEGQVVS
jgi:hypothetical protein